MTDEEEGDGDEDGEGDGEEEQQHGGDYTQKNHNFTLLFFLNQIILTNELLKGIGSFSQDSNIMKVVLLHVP